MDRGPQAPPPLPAGAAEGIRDPAPTRPEPPGRVTALGALAQGMPRLAAFEAILERILYALIIGSGLSLAALMFAQVLLRYVFASPLVGIEELSLLFGAWFYLLGIAYVTRQGEHIHGGILTMVLRGPDAVRCVRLVMTVLAAAACLVFGYYATRYALFEIGTGRLSPYMRWPKAWWSASLVFGFAATAFYLALQAFGQLVDLTSNRRQPGRE